jgi:uracil-DNA glycosylase
MRAERADALKAIEEDVLNLEHSSLADYRRQEGYLPVLGDGSCEADIVFIGEAPGKNEAKTGKPFCGMAGKILDSHLDSINLSREEIYITSIVKDRPPKNRDPRPEEIALYTPFLDRQIEIIKPKTIATLGRYAMEYVMTRYGLSSELAPIGELHGRVFSTDMHWGSKIYIVPLYHPAAAIYNQKLRETLLEDFQILKTFID